MSALWSRYIILSTHRSIFVIVCKAILSGVFTIYIHIPVRSLQHFNFERDLFLRYNSIVTLFQSGYFPKTYVEEDEEH